MQKKIPLRTSSSEADIASALAKSQEAFSSAYKSRHGKEKNSYALLARQNFDELIVSGDIYPEGVESVLEENLDVFLEEARAEERGDKDHKLDKSFSVVNGNLEFIKKENKEQSLRIAVLLGINNEQSSQITELVKNNRKLVDAVNLAEKKAEGSKAKLKSELFEIKKQNAHLEAQNERLREENKKAGKTATRLALTLFAASVLVSAAPFAAKKLGYDFDKSSTPVTLPQQEGILVYRPKVVIHNHHYFTNPIASGDGPKNDNGLLYSSEGKPVLIPQGKKVRPSGFTPK